MRVSRWIDGFCIEVGCRWSLPVAVVRSGSQTIRNVLRGFPLGKRCGRNNNPGMKADDEPIELEPATGLTPRADLRPHMSEPPPVKILSVADVHLPSAVGYERDLDAFYVDVLKFERADEKQGVLAYRAENHALKFDVLEPPLNRDSISPTMIEVPSLKALRLALIEREIHFEPMQGLDPATEYVQVKDPAGNWLNVSEYREFR